MSHPFLLARGLSVGEAKVRHKTRAGLRRWSRRWSGGGAYELGAGLVARGRGQVAGGGRLGEWGVMSVERMWAVSALCGSLRSRCRQRRHGK